MALTVARVVRRTTKYVSLIFAVYGASVFVRLNASTRTAFRGERTECTTSSTSSDKQGELAPSAPPTPKREVNDDVCSVLDRARRDHLGRRVHASAAGKRFDMFVYAASSDVRDIVSESISSTGSWERGDTEKLMPVLPHDDEELHGEKIDGSWRKKGVFLDVGANVGWFSMVALNLGHEVIAFEPFESNVELMCALLGENFHLHQLGLDFKPRRRELFQQRHVNIGDTHSVCDDKTFWITDTRLSGG